MPDEGFIYFNVSGQDAFTLKSVQLATWGHLIESLEPAMVEIGTDLLGDFEANMREEGGGFGAWSQWPPLALSTVRERARLHYDYLPMMERTGALVTSLSERGAPGNIFEATPNSIAVGTSIFYAPFHQNGSTDGRLPRRPLVGISWTRRSGIIKRIDTFVRAMAIAAGIRGLKGSGE